MSKSLPAAGRQSSNECQSSKSKTFEIWALDLVWHLSFDI
jgi:hypothetical protein